MTKRKRSAKQRANDKRLGEMARLRGKKTKYVKTKRKTYKRKPKRKTTTKRKSSNKSLAVLNAISRMKVSNKTKLKICRALDKVL